MKVNISIKRQIILILIGALISTTTAFLTNIYNAKREDKKYNIQKKLEFNDQLSKTTGERLFLTYMLYKEKRNMNSTKTDALSKYETIKENWNIIQYSYQSLLKHYYGDDIENEYIKSIYNPLIDLGQDLENNRKDTLFKSKYEELRKRTVGFIRKIYDLTE